MHLRKLVQRLTNLDITVKGMIDVPPGGARELISVGDDTLTR